MSEKFNMMGFINDVCDEIGPRFATSEQEEEAGIKIRNLLQDVDEVISEDFKCRPKAFLDFIKITFLMSIIAGILFWFLPIASVFIYIYGLSIFFFESMNLNEYIDFLFPESTGTNIIGKLKPDSGNSTKKIVLVSAHHDSAYEFPLFANPRYKLISLSTVGSIVLVIVASIIKFILDILGISNPVSNIILLLFPLISAGMVGYTGFKLHSKKLILGANDNLSGVSVVLALAKHFSTHKPKNIEIWFISFSCEECMRGSKRFVQRHFEELKNSITINMDGVGYGDLTIVSAEPYYLTKHSMQLAEEFKRSSNLPIRILPFGGTDAAFFSRKGLKAISVLGMPPKGSPTTWHQLTDAPAIIEKENLETMYNIMVNYLSELDSSLKE